MLIKDQIVSKHFFIDIKKKPNDRTRCRHLKIAYANMHKKKKHPHTINTLLLDH